MWKAGAEENNELRKRLWQYIEKNPTTIRELANDIGMVYATLRKFLQDEDKNLDMKRFLIVRNFLDKNLD